MKILDKFNPVLRDTQRYFGFLFNMGYKIRIADLKGRGMLFWSIVFESPKCLIRVFKEFNEIFVVIAPLSAIDVSGKIRIEDQVGLRPMIFYLSKGKRFIGKFEKDYYQSRKKQLETLAQYLKEYIEQIEPYFGSFEFQTYKNDLKAAHDEYNKLLLIRHVSSR